MTSSKILPIIVILIIIIPGYIAPFLYGYRSIELWYDKTSVYQHHAHNSQGRAAFAHADFFDKHASAKASSPAHL